MTEPVDVYVYEPIIQAEPVYLNELIVNNLIVVYVEQGLLDEVALPIYRTELKASAGGLIKGDLYFNQEGRLIVLGRRTGLIANLSKAVSYLRRLF